MENMADLKRFCSTTWLMVRKEVLIALVVAGCVFAGCLVAKKDKAHNSVSYKVERQR